MSLFAYVSFPRCRIVLQVDEDEEENIRLNSTMLEFQQPEPYYHTNKGDGEGEEPSVQLHQWRCFCVEKHLFVAFEENDDKEFDIVEFMKDLRERFGRV
nr:iridoid synthase-like [Ipomoea batatas]